MRLGNLCYNVPIMKETHPAPDAKALSSPETETPVAIEPSAQPSPAELRAQRLLIGGLVVAGLFLISVIVLLVFLSTNAYQAAVAGEGPTPGEVAIGVFRDASIIFVAFETSIIGVLLIILMLQVQSLIVLLRDEIKPMLEAVNETLATVRGTTQFVSRNVVSPVVKWSGYLAGLRRVVQGITGLGESDE